MNNLNSIWQLSIRNYKCYIRDKASVFFSFLSPLILLFLYLFFLADLQIAGLEGIFGNIEGFIYTADDLNVFVYNWLFANVIAISTITISLGITGNIVTDKESGIVNDYAVSPVANYKVVISYFISTFLVSFAINLFLFFVGQIFILILGGSLISFIAFLKFLVILIISLMSTIFLIMFIVSFLKTSASYSFLSIIVGTLGGFIIGAYVPINSLSNIIQIISNVIPSSLASTLFRNVFMLPSLEQLIGNIPQESYNIVSKVIKDSFSLNVYYNNYLIPEYLMYIMIGGSIVIFLGACIICYRKKGSL